MRIHYILHAAFEKLGVIEDWAIAAGHQLTGTHSYKGEKLPSADQFDFLIIMGGPQSPSELDKYPYLADEIKLTKQAIMNNKVVLGFCLGAQIIAESLGAKTERSPHREVGFFPVELTAEGKSDPIFGKLPSSFTAIHWHNDMSGIPVGAVLLASSEGCPRQAFRYGDRVYGLQFHMEITAAGIKELIINCADDLKPGHYVQSEDELLATDPADINQKTYFILDAVARVTEGNPGS